MPRNKFDKEVYVYHDHVFKLGKMVNGEEPCLNCQMKFKNAIPKEAADQLGFEQDAEEVTSWGHPSLN